MSRIKLGDLPVEVRLDICRHLDIESVFNLAQTSRSFNAIIKSNKVNLLLPILQRDFSPLDELLQVFTASADDFYTPSYTYQPRRIVFLRPGGKTAIVLAKGGFSPPEPTGEDANGFTQVLKTGKPGHGSNELPIQTVILDSSDLDSLFKYCLTVRQWEELFPHMRWIKEPAYCRFLAPHERHRFRRALYRWWLYAFYFHGDLPRPHGAQPVAFADDLRICQMRMYSTGELVEMLDLLAVVFHLVQHYICPTLEQNPAEDPWAASQVADAEVCWNDPSRLGRIIRTYAKLDPKELIHYFESIYNYPKKRLIADIRLRHPGFADDQESLQGAIRSTLQERRWLGKLPVPTDMAGGIVDFGDERDQELEKLGSDGSWDGSLPKPARIVRSYSMYNPRGDDGSGNDAWSYPSQTRPSNRLALAEVVY
ncbi:uncharacterized protein DNG_08318 [Cephalotrichum gorgonifer]|uniref:F-box domain-containing protein n=1 Tax=Cephalotrichum gorgonifer TaxID=2041049 RepID=A0AAE8N3A0_9PEZI|nr:uncharacterized protein DNG_08318 [Cephalotrichum gorgonifer]